MATEYGRTTKYSATQFPVFRAEIRVHMVGSESPTSVIIVGAEWEREWELIQIA
jgi:hypothetical protein